MSVQIYWKERLAAGCPTYMYRIEGTDVKHRKDRMEDLWPHSVARSSLFDDYLRWHNDVYLTPYRDFEYYRDRPEAMPQPADQLTFFTTMSPWLYIISKKDQIRNYPHETSVQVNGVWQTQSKGRYFVRLAELKFHVAYFEQHTGMKVNEPTRYFSPHDIAVMHEGQLEFLRLITEARKEMGLS